MFIIYINSHISAPYWQLTPVPDDTPDEFSVVGVNVFTNRPDGIYYWYLEHIASSDADFEYPPANISSRGNFSTYNYNGFINLPPIKADGITEGPEAFRVHVSESSIGDSVANTIITIQDTSTTVYIVDAGVDQTLIGQNTVNLNGFYSGNVNTVTVNWVQISGAPVTIGNVNAIQSNITLTPGSLDTVTMRLYINYGLPGELYDDVNYFLIPQDEMSILVGARMSTGPESLEFTVNPRIEV